MNKLLCGLSACILVLSGCGGGSTGSLGFSGVPMSTGASTSGLIGFDASETTIVQTSGSGYVYAFGDVNPSDVPITFNVPTDRTFLASSGVIPGSVTGTQPATGSATFNGTYQAVEVTGTAQSSDPSTWVQTTKTGSVSVTADFLNNTIQSNSGDLQFSGSLNGTTGFTGSGSFNGQQTFVRGEADGSKAVGAFAGSGPNVLHSGGFIVQ